jgi:hypothetical protein
MQPHVTDRPRLPAGYGVEDAGPFLEWSDVEARLVAATEYWLASTRPDQRPHVIPRWGIWLDDRFWYDGSPVTRHALNLEHNPACVLHLESGTEVTIVEGTSERPAPIVGELGARIAAEYRRKYEELGYAPSPDAWSDGIAGGMRVLTPVKAIAWTRFPTDLTRFSFT